MALKFQIHTIRSDGDIPGSPPTGKLVVLINVTKDENGNEIETHLMQSRCLEDIAAARKLIQSAKRVRPFVKTEDLTQ